MKRAIVVVLVVVVLAYLMRRDRLEPIDGRWAFGRSSPKSTEKSLYHLGDHPFFSRTRVDEQIDRFRFYPPDCLIYTTKLPRRTNTLYAVCGDKSPIMFTVEDFQMNRSGLEAEGAPQTIDGQTVVFSRRIPIGRITTAARKAPPYTANFVNGFYRGWGVIPTVTARFPPQAEDVNERGTTILHDAVAHQDVDNVNTLLALGMYPDLRDGNDVTPLMVATLQNTPESADIVTALLNAGADPDAQTKSGMTALMFSVRAGSPLIANLLRRAGADTTLRNNEGQRASELKPVK